MSPMHDDEERTLGSLLDEWRADEPPAGFAQGVVSAARQAGTLSTTRWTPRGLAAPLLLAALFVSLGAAAFSQSVERRVSKTEPVEAETQSELVKVTPMGYHFSQDLSQAEPDPISQAPQIEKPTVRPKAEPAESIATEAPVAAPPRVVHFPHCECGTSGVVCSCSD